MKLKSFRTNAALILTTLMLVIAAAIASPAQTFRTLVRFDGTNGEQPQYMSLIQGRDGYLYGTAAGGGANNEGAVFKITPNGTLTTVYSFCSQSGCPDGYQPAAGLVQGGDGSFYGTTVESGDVPPPCESGCGTIFKITPAGTLTTLYDFCSQANCADGFAPYDALVESYDGDFYGTTYEAGDFTCFPPVGCGTVFKITPSGTLTTLHVFEGTDGLGAYGAAMVQGIDGNFYGVTSAGGNMSTCYAGCGTVFKITPSGALTTLYRFCSQGGCSDGSIPYTVLVQASDGTLYGTTSGGGSGSSCGVDGGCGTVFKITPNGTLTTLYNFCSQPGCTDGVNPWAGLVLATDGNFYGTTFGGGAFSNCPVGIGCGTVFKITPAGTLTTLHNFALNSGANPAGALTQATNGIFYGTTSIGGAKGGGCGDYYGCGTIFGLSMGLGPFVETQPALGKAGATVKILGTHLTGATSVSFNGTAAGFTVLSGSLIKATVPEGATTGFVTVTTTSGALTSNVQFRVRP